MTELEKIEYAKSFIDKLANGINPIDDSVIPDGDVVNNVRLSRCFFYVSGILGRVIENGGIFPNQPTVEVKEKRPKKPKFSLTEEEKASFNFSEKPIHASEFADRLTAVAEAKGMKKFPRRNIGKWMITVGMLEDWEVDGKIIKRPTDIGKEIGIILEERNGAYGTYFVVLYTLEAQHFVIDNLDAIVNLDNSEYKAKINMENQGKTWTKEEEERLIEMFGNGVPLREIATALGRGEKGVRTRLRKFGITVD